MESVTYTIKHRRGFSSEWSEINPVLNDGEIGVEKDTGLFKLGDGFHSWAQLDYYLPAAAIQQAIDAAIEGLTPGGTSGAIAAAIDAHVDSAYPHPVYDDGPSLLLFYKNAKV